MSFVNESGLLEFVLEPTRHENTLDLPLTNVPNLTSDLQVQCPLQSTSDHNLVKLSVNTCCDHNSASDNPGIIDQLYYDLSSDDYELMQSYLMNVNCSYQFIFVFSIKDYWQIFARHLHRVSKKRPTNALLYFDAHKQILTFFGRNVIDKVGNQKVL